MKSTTVIAGLALVMAGQIVILMLALGCSQPDPTEVRDTPALHKRIENQYLEISIQRKFADHDRGKKLPELEYQYTVGNLAIAMKTLDRAKTAASQDTPVAIHNALSLLETAEEMTGHTITYLQEKGLK